ncbi:MAG: metallophosphoesterase family protein [Janthinobacterium lividum]
MRFIHTSDWQVGKTFRLVDDETLAILRAERLEVISRIGRLAQQHGACAVLVAGDVFDVTGVSLTTLLQPIERMRQFTAVEWHLIPGNHDAHGTDGPWERLLRTSLPENIKLHTTPEPQQITGTSAWVLPAVLTQRHSLVDTTLPMDSMSTPEGALRIGLAHGSVRSFGSTDASTNNLLAIDRASKANLAYLALGDWHGSVQIDERTWYSGTPEPDGFAKGGEGGGSVLLVNLDEDRSSEQVPLVTHLATGRFLWREETAALHDVMDISALEARVRSLDADLSRVLLRVEVNGSLDLPARENFEATIRTGLSGALRTLILNDAGLLVKPTAADLESIDHIGFVRVAADRLAIMAVDTYHPDHELAAAALQRLYLLHVQQGAQAR